MWRYGAVPWRCGDVAWTCGAVTRQMTYRDVAPRPVVALRPGVVALWPGDVALWPRDVALWLDKMAPGDMVLWPKGVAPRDRQGSRQRIQAY